MKHGAGEIKDEPSMRQDEAKPKSE